MLFIVQLCELAHLVQREAWVPGDGKVVVKREVLDILGRVAHSGGGLDLGEALAHKQDAVYQHPVGGALDLKVAEEGVCAKEQQHLVQDVVALAIGLGRVVERYGRVRVGERVGRAARLGAERQQREVADQARRGVAVEDGVVGLSARELARDIRGGPGYRELTLFLVREKQLDRLLTGIVSLDELWIPSDNYQVAAAPEAISRFRAGLCRCALPRHPV